MQANAQGLITEGERYLKVIDAWTHAREKIGEDMLSELRNDTRDGKPYVNPIFCMVMSKARGSVEQIRQLAGMRGLMAKPSGKIIESPIRANFREGLRVLEYFSSTHGARKGLADTALKTADSGYLTRKLADVAQNVVITIEDCGTPNGVEKGTVYQGDKVAVPFVDAVRGRVTRQTVVDHATGEVVVEENELDHGRRRSQDRAGHRVRVDPGALAADLRGAARRLRASATAWTCRAARSPSRAWRSASSPRSRSVSRARS
jgi:DNA-directed RNA polymerase subunit beta'